MNRQERRTLAHKERKLARKLGFPAAQNTEPESEPEPMPVPEETNVASPLTIPEPPAPFPPLSAISPARLAANRANAQKSHGPTTSAGVAVSSQNRTVHGLARHNGVFQLLPSEDAAGFEALKASLAAEHQPETETEAILLNTMAESHWLANRAQNLQASCFDPATSQITDPQLFSLYMRYQSTHARAFNKSLNDLHKLRKERRTAEIGFEAQQRQTEKLRIATEKHEMKKNHHYWDVLLKDSKACHQIIMTLTQQNAAIQANPGFEAQFDAELANRGLKQQRGPWNVAVAA